MPSVDNGAPASTSIYDRHSTAFAQVSAWVILDQSGERIATVAIKHPRDGAGRLYAYVHWVGTTMARGWASGGGYDKITAAVSSAADRMGKTTPESPNDWARFVEILRFAQVNWVGALEAAGFRVLQAV